MHAKNTIFNIYNNIQRLSDFMAPSRTGFACMQAKPSRTNGNPHAKENTMWWAPVQRILRWAQLAGPAGPCTGRHQDHICFLASRKNFERIKNATEKPAFVCSNCGRVAGKRDNLCNPVLLDTIAPGVPPIV